MKPLSKSYLVRISVEIQLKTFRKFILSPIFDFSIKLRNFSIFYSVVIHSNEKIKFQPIFFKPLNLMNEKQLIIKTEKIFIYLS